MKLLFLTLWFHWSEKREKEPRHTLTRTWFFVCQREARRERGLSNQPDYLSKSHLARKWGHTLSHSLTEQKGITFHLQRQKGKSNQRLTLELIQQSDPQFVSLWGCEWSCPLGTFLTICFNSIFHSIQFKVHRETKKGNIEVEEKVPSSLEC